MPTGCAIWQDDRQISFAELHQRVTALAEHWRRSGCSRVSRVGASHERLVRRGAAVCLVACRGDGVPHQSPIAPARHDADRRDRCRPIAVWTPPRYVRRSSERRIGQDDSGPTGTAAARHRRPDIGQLPAPPRPLSIHWRPISRARVVRRSNIPLTRGRPVAVFVAHRTTWVDWRSWSARTRRSVVRHRSHPAESWAKKLRRVWHHACVVGDDPTATIARQSPCTPTGLKAVLLGGSSYPPTLIHDSCADKDCRC